jgi:hypothetical protein
MQLLGGVLPLTASMLHVAGALPAFKLFPAIAQGKLD